MQVYYLIRSRSDGNYLVAHPQRTPEQPGPSYLLVFREDFEALSFLNAHNPQRREEFAIESLPQNQVAGVLKRWDFQGIGLVEDPLIPNVSFLSYQKE